LLAQRVATAAVGIPILLGLILVGGAAFAALVAIAMAIAAVEFQHPRHGWTGPLTLLAGVLAGAMPAAAYFGQEWIVLAAAIALVAPLAIIVPRGIPGERASDWAWTVAGVMYVGFLGSLIVLLREGDDGRDWVLLALFSTFAVDTSAYFVGRAIGRRPLAPRISPKKTVEGFAAGCVCGFAAVVVLNYALGLPMGIGAAVALGVLLPLAATAGDLAESAYKRGMGIKDTSELVPGHGGALDRLDSVLFTFTLVYLFAEWVVR
jgi:phosphatidate cytidylyltransferase